MNKPVDAGVRARAVDVSGSFIVSAPAGSGKTELLSQRVLALLAVVDEPESVLAITFTKKAQGEMLGRIISTLSRVADGAVDGMNPESVSLAKAALARDAEMGWNIIHNPSRLRIKTIDSFLGGLAGRAPVAGMMAGGLRVADNPDACYRNAARQLMGEIESDAFFVPDLAAVMRHVGNDFMMAEEMFVGLLKNRDQWLPLVLDCRGDGRLREVVERSLGVVRGSLVDGVVGGLGALIPALEDMVLFAGARIDADSPHAALSGLAGGLVDMVDVDGWRVVADWLLTSEGEPRKKLAVAQGFPAASKATGAEKAVLADAKSRMESLCAEIGSSPAALEALRAVRKAPPATFGDGEWAVLEALLSLLPVLAGKLALVFSREGVVDHVAVAASALSVLGGDDAAPSDAMLAMDNQICHILVDEFQDTDSRQVEMLRRLMAGWQPDDGRTLFLVGDAMQSIYSFRGSNVGIFIDVAERGMGGFRVERLDLTVNFRSSPVIVDWVNAVFSKSLPAANDCNTGAVTYSAAVAHNPCGDNDAAEVVVFTGVDPEAAEAKYVAEKISAIRAQSPGDSVAVLVRNRSHATAVCGALRKLDIGYQAVEMESLKNRLVVRDIATLARAVIRLHDRISWVALLRSPLCGLGMDDMEAVCSGSASALVISRLRKINEIDGVSEDGVRAVKRLMAVMLPTLQQRERKSLRHAVEGAWLALGGAASVVDAIDMHSMHDVWAVLDELTWSSTNEDIDLLFSRIYASPGSSKDACVQVMTIHKSKGLQFDHVFVPRADKVGSLSDPELLLWDSYIQDGDVYPLISASRPYGEADSAIHEHIKFQAKRREINEAARLMYVACTRPKSSLHISAVLGSGDDATVKAPSGSSLLGQIWGAVAESAATIKAEYDFDAEAGADDGRPAAVQPTVSRAIQGLAGAMPEGCELLAEYRGQKRGNNANFELEQWVVSDESAVAKTVKAVLAHGVLINRESLLGARAWVSTHEPVIKALLKQHGLAPFMVPQAARRVAEQVVGLAGWLVEAAGGADAVTALTGPTKKPVIGDDGVTLADVACTLTACGAETDYVFSQNAERAVLLARMVESGEKKAA